MIFFKLVLCKHYKTTYL